MVGLAVGQSTLRSEVEVAEAEAPQFEHVVWYKDSGLKKLYFWAAILCVASATTGYDGMMLNTAQAIDQWQTFFGSPTGSRLGLMNSIYMIGSICSFPIVPYMADWWGRRVPIAVGCLFMILGGLMGTFANGYGLYVGGRFILGFGNSLAQLSSPVLLTELCHPQHRAKVTAVYNCLWNLGALFVAWIAWGTVQIKGDWSWRILALFQIIPALIQITFIYWVPESPRWLVSKERHEEALAILAKYHANGDERNDTVQFEFREIKETIALEFEHKRTSSYMDFLRTRGNRYRLALLISLGVISQYSGNALFSNYINLIYNSMGITEQNKKIPLNGGQTILSLLVSTGAAFLVDRVGRRPLFLISTSGMVVCFVAWTITSSVFEKQNPAPPAKPTHMGSGYPQIAFVWLFGVSYSLAWSGLLVAYSLEILPFKLRAKGLMIMNLTVQAALVLGNQTNPIAWQNIKEHWKFELFYTVWIFLELCFVYFFYVETRGPTLEELAKIFDGENAEVAHVDMSQVHKEMHQNELDREPGYVEREQSNVVSDQHKLD